MVLMIHRNFGGKEGPNKPSQRFFIKAQSGFSFSVLSARMTILSGLMRRFYVYDPANVAASKAPLLAIFGALDTPEGVKANVREIKQILDQAGRRDYTVKVYPNGRHNLMDVPPDNPNEYVRLKRFRPGFFETMVDWTTTQLRRRAPRC